MAVLRGAVIFAAIVCATFVHSDDKKPVEIPLKNIWARNMPGTKDLKEIESKEPDEAKNQTSDTTKQPRPGFAVAGTGREALIEAREVLFDRKPEPEKLAADSEISIVFFTYLFGDYVHLDRVERQGTTINIYYRFVPHYEREVTSHFALIPLGKLPTGKYDVKIVQLPMDSRLVPEAANLVDEKAGGKYICKPFSFSVNKE